MPQLGESKPSPEAIAYLIHHLVLPPKLPQGEDANPHYELILLRTTIQALQEFQTHFKNPAKSVQIESVIFTVTNLLDSLGSNGSASELRLGSFLAGLTTGATQGLIPVEIKAQNAGLIVSRHQDSIVFESFELSPTNHEALAAKGRLVRSFPAYASMISAELFQEADLRITLAQTIAKLASQPAPGFQPQVRKAKQNHDEMRDTTHPGMVTNLFMNVISALGEPTHAPTIWKNTREDVLWSNSKQPWRRSPLWLLLRVSMQLQFSRATAFSESKESLYKPFMVFLLSTVLHLASQYPQVLGTEILHATSAKLSRRIKKLETLSQNMHPPPDWMDPVCKTLFSTHDLISKKWKRILNGTPLHVDAAELEKLRPENDLNVELPELDRFVDEMGAREKVADGSKFQPTVGYRQFSAYELPSSFAAYGEYQYFQLAAVECWVECHLTQWLDDHIGDQNTTKGLRDLIQAYHHIAKSAYAGLPISLSIMYLVIMELWVACDKSACHIHPLLRDFDTEVPMELLQSLLLPFEDQMGRLCDVESHIRLRRELARNHAPSLFRDFGNSSSFAVKFFDQSPSHQALLSRIEQGATDEKLAKCTELFGKKESYKRCMELFEQISECEYHWVITNKIYGTEERRHVHSCKKCHWKALANKLEIKIHEWPLSSNQNVAKSTIFELDLPQAFGNWRDATVFLLSDVFHGEYEQQQQPRASYTLLNDQGLSSFLNNYGPRRIVLLSQVKPNTKTHRKKKGKGAIINLNNEDVCVNNGLQYQYFDHAESIFTDTLFYTDQVLQNCTYELPARSLSLQKYLLRSPSQPDGVPPNEVIASQSECPSHISLDEYKAFGSLPLGHRIQYMNILTQLSMPVLDFAKVETQLLIHQTILQAGHPSTQSIVQRATHAILAEESFGNAMIDQLNVALQRVSENWESWRALASFVQLTTRLLTLAPTSEIQEKCGAYLDRARNVSLGWVNTITLRARMSPDDRQRAELYSRAVEVALLCISTFNMDQDQVTATLQESSKALILLQCSIVVQENKDTVSSEHDPLYRAMLQSWRSLAYRTFPILKYEIISQGNNCLNDAVAVSWSDFRPASSWQSLHSPHEHWLVMKPTLENHNVTPLNRTVHFNLLTAELLVDGLPLARLPQEYMCHPMYSPLFGKSTLEVMPTTVPGLKFSAKHAYQGYKIHIGMQRSDMLVNGTHNGQNFDLLPQRLFNTKFPTAFVEGFIHWYNHNNNKVEFRPRNDPWSDNSTNWCLEKLGPSWRLTKPGRSLVSMSSNTTAALAKVLSPLESHLHTHALFDESSGSLDIEVPRLKLSFYLGYRGSQIHSRQYRGMFVDPYQEFGTLVGLSSKLVLNRGDGDRLVLIPEGSVTYSKTVDHVAVCIDKNTVAKVHAYQLDTTLGRLVDNGNLQSKLFLCHLHALTSYCLPDPLTGHTGTEAAISILRSGAVRSFDMLTKGNISTMELIAKLAPKRLYYPQNERVMQEVGWDQRLFFLSQAPILYTLVEEIFDQARMGRLFYSPEIYTEPPILNHIEPHLLQRDLIRSSTFRVSEFGAEHYTLQFDKVYQPRDRDQTSACGQRSFVAATLILRDYEALHNPTPPELFETLRRTYFGQGTIDGSGHLLPRLAFDSEWLSDPSSLIPPLWCSLHSSLASSPNSYVKFDIAMWLSTVAFAETADMNIIEALAAFYKVQELEAVGVPPMTEFHLSNGEIPNFSQLQGLVRSASRSFYACPEATLPKQSWETNRECQQRRASEFESNRDAAVDSFIRALESQWPCKQPSTPASPNATTYLDVSKAMAQVSGPFKAWHDNRRFYQYLENVARALRRQSAVTVSAPQFSIYLPARQPAACGDPYFSTKAVFDSTAPRLRSGQFRSLNLPLEELTKSSRDMETRSRLTSLCQELRAQAESKCEKEYVLQLEHSFSALQESPIHPRAVRMNSDTVALLNTHLENCNENILYLSRMLENTTKGGPRQSHQAITACIQHSPRLSPTFWLRQLNREYWVDLTKEWKTVVIKYGLAITELQRAHRLLSLSDSPLELADEFRNSGHQNWDPSNFPESLLLEAESGIMIRKVQEEIASEMRSPPNNQNSVMQLNMGEGKSTVIVPAVAVDLADGSRVIVGKSQSRQMFQMLVSKLGCLLNRRIYHMPFSRALKLKQHDADIIRKICQDCMANRGILLVQPEHLLSFKLMGIECLLSDRRDTGESMLSTQHFFDTKSRDIVDESDENFSVKFELVYTMGSQRPIELSPERWNVIHIILDLVSHYAMEVKNLMPDAIEFDNRWAGRFPRVRTLRADAGNILLGSIAKHICSIGFMGFPVARQPQRVRNAILRYITEPGLTTDEIAGVEEEIFWTELTKGPLLLVRGLIAGGVLRFVLGSKRWTVNFGIDPNRKPRTRLAVPFRSKDSPSARSEFSHPDVVIILTSLTYYYGGLDADDFFDTFNHLLKSDQADIEYGEWVRTAAPSLEEPFRQLVGINIKDRFQCVEKVFPGLRYSKGMIDYFLAHIVFPKEIKEFPYKLSASGWDIGQVKSYPTTGFSGTNDSRHVLPLNVEHLDLHMQKHTNALVLAYLLGDENAVEILPPRLASQGSDAEHLLNTINNMIPPTRVILDVGAQILELNNRQVAHKWLSMSNEGSSRAVVFFNDDEELSVLDRRGCVELLQVSSFAKQLGDCLIYLDEAHTRGTDLKLPRESRAAVTLGANLTKDRLVQACMRMRKLGKGQSVVFCIPEEIQTKIYERNPKLQNAKIDVAHVLTWAISETWADLRRSMLVWATQGRRFEDHKHLLDGVHTSNEQAKKFLEVEAQTVDYRYRPHSHMHSHVPQLDGWDTSNENITRIIARCQDFNTMNFNSATLQEEQERELSPEIEEERQIEHPVPMMAEAHNTHKDLIRLVQTGQVRPKSRAFLPAFQALSSSSAASLIDLSQFPTELLVTADFARTVKRPSSICPALSDSFQRPVQWILSVLDCQNLVILSPFEVNELLPAIRQSSRVTLHLYSPRPNLGYQPLDGLDLYTLGRQFSSESTPRSLIVQLNLFAGQLYLRSFYEYVEVCRYLGLAWSVAKDGEVVRADGFVVPAVGKWGLQDSPVNFLRVLLTKVRRNCEGVGKTHLGKVLDGALLEQSDFE
ncbi:hypothetical protein P154DRAFT_593169 [Amniculicola lignicola CBS 123094]|uniref:ubiquitinyl hydrolase 1 n=1 Tax=Amniculicola lignicola CBS 123094 TaxID=1392246 RepID=A0A6A5X3W8_9PLEO|nr:hypothetical protein P154DRAFT_593169 [Amniculicola lignicola CBS 123094]